MKETRNYINTLQKGLLRWRWLNNDPEVDDIPTDKIIALINARMAQIKQLSVGAVEDEILQDKDGITWRLERLESMGWDAVVNYIEITKDVVISHVNDEIKEMLTTYRRLIERRAAQLQNVINECRGMVAPPPSQKVQKALQNPMLLNIFFGNKDALRTYIEYCEYTNRPTDCAIEAARLGSPSVRKVRADKITNELWQELRNIGFDFNYNTWRTAKNKR